MKLFVRGQNWSLYLKQLRGRGRGRCNMGETSTTSPSARCFILKRVLGQCPAPAPPHPLIYGCHSDLLIIFSWAGSRRLSQIFWPRRVKRQGNRNETRVFYQLSCQQGQTSNIFPQIRATPSHLKAVGSHGASYSSVCSPTVGSPWVFCLPFFSSKGQSTYVGNLCSRCPWTKKADHL